MSRHRIDEMGLLVPIGLFAIGLGLIGLGRALQNW